MKEIKIGNRIVGENQPCLIIAEAGVNHDGELEKAKQASKNGIYEDVLNHLRPAIEMAIKEKFGFKRVNMYRFLQDARALNFNLPSYDSIYYYYSEGSGRLHKGKLNTPLECQKAIDFVANFIGRLDEVTTSQQEIDDFKSKSKAVE